MFTLKNIACSLFVSAMAAIILPVGAVRAQENDPEPAPSAAELFPLPDKTYGVSSFPAQRQNTASVPSQTGSPQANDVTPFDGAGFRIGTLRGTIELEQQIGHSSNSSNLPAGEPGFFSLSSGALSLTSDWQRHQMQITADGSYRRPFDNEIPGFLEASTALSVRMDLRDGITLTPSLNYSVASQSFSSRAGSSGVERNPLVHTYGASLTLERDIGLFSTSLRGDISRDQYENAELRSGFVIDNSDLDDTEFGATLRLGYNLSPVVKPFIEGRYALRERDQSLDRRGIARDAIVTELRGGIEIDRGDKLNGEFALGFVNERFEDASLEDLSGFTVSSALNWSPFRQTTVSLDLSTSTNPSLLSTTRSGSLVYQGRVSIEHNLTERLTATGFAGLEIETGERGSTTTEIGIGAEYHVSRALSLTAALEAASFDSKLAGADYDDVSALVGVKWQK